MDARNGSARFFLDSDRNDMDALRAIEVRLTGSCDTSGASRVPSDREGMRRFERVTQVSPTYIGSRYYVFEGGCITVLFTLSGDDRAEPLAVATQMHRRRCPGRTCGTWSARRAAAGWSWIRRRSEGS